MTSTHHSSPATSRAARACSATDGMVGLAEQRGGDVLDLSRAAARPATASPSSWASWRRRMSRSKRLASSSSSRTADGSPARCVERSRRRPRPTAPSRRPGRRTVSTHWRCGADEEVVEVHPGDDLRAASRRAVAGSRSSGVGRWRAVERRDQAEAGLEEPLGQRLLERALGAGQVLAEVLEVAAEVEDEEVLLVLAGPEQVGAQPGAAADHLPELASSSGPVLKKTRLTTSGTSMPVSSMSTQIAMCGALSGDREVVDQALGVRRAVGDDAGEVAGVARGSARSKRCSMNSACFWFLAKMIVLPSRSPPATL